MFFQDDWRVSPRLTLNLGLRYSYYRRSKRSTASGATSIRRRDWFSRRGGTLWNPDHKDFSPRAGFCLDVTGRGTTVVRGGFSIIYSTFTAVTFLNENGFQNSRATSVSVAAVPTAAQYLETNGLRSWQAAAPPGSGNDSRSSLLLCQALALHWNSPGPVFPSSATPQCGDGISLDASPCNIMAVDPNLTTPYITNWSLGIQHAFGNNLSLEVGYVGNHGSRLTGFRDINQTVPSLVNATAIPAASRFTPDSHT